MTKVNMVISCSSIDYVAWLGKIAPSTSIFVEWWVFPSELE